MYDSTDNINSKVVSYGLDQLSEKDLLQKTILLLDEREELNRFITEMALMRQKQKEGDIDWFMPADHFSEVFRIMAEGVNEQVGDHIAVKKRIVEIIRHIGDGDFSQKMEDLPGKKAFITRDVNSVVTRIQMIVSEIDTLSQEASAGNLSFRTDAGKYTGDWKGMVLGINAILDETIAPIDEAIRILGRIRGGDLSERMERACSGDHARMKDSVNGVHDWLSGLIRYISLIAGGDMSAEMTKASETDQIHEHLIKMRENIKNLVHDTAFLSKEATSGKLDARADASRHQGEYRKIITGFNDTLDAIVGPLNVAAEYVDRISKGDIPPRITDSYAGDFNEIKNNLNTCIDAISLLIADVKMLADAGVKGRLNIRADSSEHQGDFQIIVDGMNSTLDSVTNPLNDAAAILERMAVNDYTRVMDENAYQGDFKKIARSVNNVKARVQHIEDSVIRISKGDLTKLAEYQKIGKRSEEDLLVPAFIRAFETLQELKQEFLRLTEVSRKGNLSERGRADQFEGAYAEILTGTNQMLDAILTPINEGNRILRQIRGGNLREKVEIPCYGDHEEMKKAINGVHAWLSDLISYVTHIYQGDMTVSMGKASEDDQIHEYLILMRDNIRMLVSDIHILAGAAVQGNLNTRADAEKHRGDYRKIVDGMNATLESVVLPVQEALRVSQAYAAYQFIERFDPSLPVAGDWIVFKSALDNIGIQISAAVDMINHQLTDLLSYTEETLVSISDISVSSQQIAQNAEGVNLNAERGNEGIKQVLKAMEDMTITVSAVSQRAEGVSSFATQANQFSKNGVELAKRSEESMAEITLSATEADRIVHEINTQMEEIGKIIRLISDIASQTNLLALNAAIEAARAGEAGRGFAVVAAEVKSLAQDSRQSAENITEMIAALREKAQQATMIMTQTGKTVETGSRSLVDTVGAFDKIASFIEDITRNVSDVASASEELAASVQEVTASVNEVSNLVTNTTKEAGDAAAATQEASASIEQISQVINNMNGIVDSVSREIAKFIV